MDRCDSKVCLLDSDELDVIHHKVTEMEGESSSSGYDSSDYCSDDDVPLVMSRPARHPIHSRPAPPSARGQVMMFRSTGNLQDSLAFILDMPEMCDVTFLVGKKQVPVHGVKAILATRSRVLYQLVLQHKKKMDQESVSKKSKKHRRSPPSHKLVINVMDYKAEDFRHFITFVHSGKVKVDLNNVIGLLCAAAEFDFPDLQTACLDFIRRCQPKGNKSALLALAWDYQHKKIAQKLICQLSTVTR